MSSGVKICSRKNASKLCPETTSITRPSTSWLEPVSPTLAGLVGERDLGQPGDLSSAIVFSSWPSTPGAVRSNCRSRASVECKPP